MNNAMPKRLQASMEEREQFEHFLFEMSDVLEAFVLAASRSGFKLDYSLESLDDLERYWDSTGERERDGLVANQAARYLGETFRRNLGGKWTLCVKDSDYLYLKLPVISDYAKMDIEFCPIMIFGNYVVRKQHGVLRRAVEANAEFKRGRR